jgi:hypothetical protein
MAFRGKAISFPTPDLTFAFLFPRPFFAKVKSKTTPETDIY